MNNKNTIQICENGATRGGGIFDFYFGSYVMSVKVKETDTKEQVAEKLNAEVKSKYNPIPCTFEAVDAMKLSGVK